MLIFRDELHTTARMIVRACARSIRLLGV